MEITFVRHAESTSNVSGRWQGHGDAPLSERGREQARALAERLKGRDFDLVVSSDLSRAAETARALGRPVETDPGWREVDVGAWEGLTREEVATRFAGEIAALRRGEDVPIGGGESWSAMHARIGGALERLRERLETGAQAVVFSHGGAIHGLVAGLMGLLERRPRPIGRLANTAVTTLRFEDDRVELLVYNDVTHLEPLPTWARERHEAGDTVLTLVGHVEGEDGEAGEAEAVAGGRLRSAGPLLEVERLGGWYRGPSRTYAVGRGSLRNAAAVLAERMGTPLAEAAEPDDPRALIEELTARHPGERLALVMDAASIGRHATAIFGHGEAGPRVGLPRHTGVSHLVVSSYGHTLADYNVGDA